MKTAKEINNYVDEMNKFMVEVILGKIEKEFLNVKLKKNFDNRKIIFLIDHKSLLINELKKFGYECLISVNKERSYGSDKLYNDGYKIEVWIPLTE